MRSHIRPHWGLVTIILFCGHVEIANAEIFGFEDDINRPISISSFPSNNSIIDRADTVAMLAAKKVVGKFFRSLENSDDALRYMTPASAKRFGDKTSLRKALVAGETQLIEVGVTDFSMKSGRSQIAFKVYVLSFSEGSLALSECSMTLEWLTDRWAIAEVCDLGKSSHG